MIFSIKYCLNALLFFPLSRSKVFSLRGLANCIEQVKERRRRRHRRISMLFKRSSTNNLQLTQVKKSTTTKSRGGGCNRQWCLWTSCFAWGVFLRKLWSHMDLDQFLLSCFTLNSTTVFDKPPVLSHQFLAVSFSQQRFLNECTIW